MRAGARKRGAVTRAGAAGGGQVAELSYAVREVRPARARAGRGHRGRDRRCFRRPCARKWATRSFIFAFMLASRCSLRSQNVFCPQEQGARAEAEEARAQAEEAYGCISQQVWRGPAFVRFSPALRALLCFLSFECTYDWPGPQHLHSLPVQIDRIREVEIERRQVALPHVYTPCPHP